MTLKDKIKKFYEDHEGEFVRIGYYAVGVGVGYGVAYYVNTVTNLDTGVWADGTTQLRVTQMNGRTTYYNPKPDPV